MQHRFKIIFSTPSGEQSFEATGSSIKDVKREADARVVAMGGVSGAWRSERLQDNAPEVEA